MRKYVLRMSLLVALLGATSLALTHSQQSAAPAAKFQTELTQTPPADAGRYWQQSTVINQQAIDLQAEVAKTTKDQLSLAVVRKAERLEKYLHTLKQQMKTEAK